MKNTTLNSGTLFLLNEFIDNLDQEINPPFKYQKLNKDDLVFRYWSPGIRYDDNSGWDILKGWWEPFQYGFEGSDEPSAILRIIKNRGIIVEQFTGRFDRKRTPIFAGDIAKYHFFKEYDEYGEYREVDKIEIGIVKKGEGMYVFSGNKYEPCIANTCVDWVEVIGNIHEDEKLINNKK